MADPFPFEASGMNRRYQYKNKTIAVKNNPHAFNISLSPSANKSRTSILQMVHKFNTSKNCRKNFKQMSFRPESERSGSRIFVSITK